MACCAKLIARPVPGSFWKTWQQLWGKGDSPPQSPSAAAPRIKTYAAQTGFVYQYFHNTTKLIEAGTEYHFSVSTGREPFRTFVVQVPVLSRERALRKQERYAVAKLALFRCFDEQQPLGERVIVQEPELHATLDTLGIP